MKYYTGPWTLGSYVAGSTTANQGTYYTEPLSDAWYLRARQDDDVDITKRLVVGVSGGLLGVMGGQLPLGTLRAEVSGTVSGYSVVEHELRRQVEMKQKLVQTGEHPTRFNEAEDGLRIIPRTSANVWLNINGYLEWRIPLPWPISEDIVFTLRPFGSSGQNVPIHNTVSSWGWEKHFRLGTGSNVNVPDEMNQPTVSSNWPNGSSFSSFPTNVPTCLADNTPRPNYPPTCIQKQDTGGAPPDLKMCVRKPPSSPGCAFTVGTYFVNLDDTGKGTRFLQDAIDFQHFDAVLHMCYASGGQASIHSVLDPNLGFCDDAGNFTQQVISEAGAGSGAIVSATSCQ